tara:strand:+ start:2105 stop:2260 length:156 start_codon:yes stop_codon:yes gene_type:complete
MVLLLVLVLVLQCSFYLILRPFIDLLNPLFDWRLYAFGISLFGIWMFSGKE